RARDGQPRLRPRSRPPRLDPAHRRADAHHVAAPAGARPRQPRRLRLPPRAARRPAHRVPDQLPQVGPQPRPRGRGARPARGARRARPDARRLPPDRRAAGAPPRCGDRVVLVRRAARGPGDPPAHGPDLGQRPDRPPRTPADPALDRAAATARADRRARGGAAFALHRPHPRPVVPRGHGAVRLVRHRVGPDRHRAAGAHGARRVGAALQGRPRPDPHRHAGPRRPARPVVRPARCRRPGPLRRALRPRAAGHAAHVGAGPAAAARPGPGPALPGHRPAAGRPARAAPATATGVARRRGGAAGPRARRGRAAGPRAQPRAAAPAARDGGGVVTTAAVPATGATAGGPGGAHATARRARTRRETWVALGFTLPTIFGFVVFYLWPSVRGLGLSFTDYRFFSDTSFVGLANYQRLLADETFWNAMAVTVWYVVLNIGFQTVLAVLLAVLLHRLTRSVVIRGLVLMPYLVANVVVA